MPRKAKKSAFRLRQKAVTFHSFSLRLTMFLQNSIEEGCEERGETEMGRSSLEREGVGGDDGTRLANL